MLTDYCAAVLRRELAGSDYDGLTADAAWAWLMEPVARPPLTRPTGIRLTPVVLAGLVGVDKAEAVAGAVKAAYPHSGDHLMSEGVDPLKAETRAFLSQLAAGGLLTADDVATVAAAAAAVTPQPPLPRRFDRRFDPERWPHVAEDGSAGTDTDPAISGFPNDLSRDDFGSAWQAAGRS